MTPVEMEKQNELMSQAVASLRAIRLEALAVVGSAWDFFSGDTASSASQSFLNNEALNAINSLDTAVRARVNRGEIGISSWSATAGELYKNISSEATVSSWSLWGVLSSTVDASYSEAKEKIEAATPFALGGVAIAVLILLLLVFLRVA